MREPAATFVRNRRLIGLFVLMVVVPAFVFSALLVRAIRSEELRLAYQTVERQREILQQAEGELNTWLFSSNAESARSHAALRFSVAGGDIVFPDFGLRLPASDESRVRPFESPAVGGLVSAETIVAQYYPRIQAFLRDASGGRHPAAQYFLRLRGLIVLPPGSVNGYVVHVDPLLDHINQRLAAMCANEPFTATVWVADQINKTGPVAVTYGMRSFPFFELVFTDAQRAGMIAGRSSHAFAYAMTLLVGITVLGSVFVHRALTHEVRLSHLRNDFVAAVSHEFRSPLASILALAERLTSQRAVAPGQLAEYHRIIEHDARRLSALVTRLLEFGRIERGRVEYTPSPVDLVEVTHHAIEATRHAIPPPRLRFEAAGPLWVKGDATALSHAVQNLIENAGKYSAADAPIFVTCRSGTGSHVVEVRDCGIGVPSAEQERIFEKFYRGRAVGEMNVQGVGIGLTLVKHVIDAHGGSVVVESREGHGSCFRLLLPSVDHQPCNIAS